MRGILRLVAACTVVVAVASACSSTAPSAPPAAPAGSMTTTERAIAADLLARLSRERVARGLRPLVDDPYLVERSAAWSRTMPSLAVPGRRLNHSDLNPLLARYTAAAENIAWTGGGTAGLVHTSWMRSDGHRRNMLTANVDVVGIGVYCAPGGEMWVTESFGRTPYAAGDPAFSPVPPVDPIAVPGDDGPAC